MLSRPDGSRFTGEWQDGKQHGSGAGLSLSQATAIHGVMPCRPEDVMYVMKTAGPWSLGSRVFMQCEHVGLLCFGSDQVLSGRQVLSSHAKVFGPSSQLVHHAFSSAP